MERNNIVYMLIGALFGSLLTIIVAATVVDNHNASMMKAMGMHTDGASHSMNMDSMEGM